MYGSTPPPPWRCPWIKSDSGREIAINDSKKVGFLTKELPTAPRFSILFRVDDGVLTLGRTRKFIPLEWSRWGGGGVDGTPPESF